MSSIAGDISDDNLRKHCLDLRPSVSHFPETADIETSSDGYAQRFAGEVGAWFLRVQEDATLRLLRAFPKARILDVGGGHGQLAPALVHHGYHVTVLGSDASCQKRLQPLLARKLCSFDIGNILALPYANQEFDVVVSYRLLPHVQAWQQCIAELTRVAQQAVLIDYPAICSVNYIAPLLFKVKKGLEGNTRPYTSFKEQELLAVFHTHGFYRADRFAEFFLPMVLHRMMRFQRLSWSLEAICRVSGLTAMCGSPVILKLLRSRQV
jgi:2-polyprenyl-3-methyl-5-hydroxy-6-metoxy-1,4-benzoquinol methylase